MAKVRHVRLVAPRELVARKQTRPVASNMTDEMCSLLRKTYNVKRLNAGQRTIFDYVFNNTGKITLIQAGPGMYKVLIF